MVVKFNDIVLKCKALFFNDLPTILSPLLKLSNQCHRGLNQHSINTYKLEILANTLQLFTYITASVTLKDVARRAKKASIFPFYNRLIISALKLIHS